MFSTTHYSDCSNPTSKRPDRVPHEARLTPCNYFEIGRVLCRVG